MIKSFNGLCLTRIIGCSDVVYRVFFSSIGKGFIKNEAFVFLSVATIWMFLLYM